ncbi:MAG: TAT-variant-translocated molybdopterin oxidoreductase [Pseudolabrys sp.]
MTKPEAPRFDLARVREVTGHGSKRFWSSLEELIDEEGFRAWLSGEFPAASSMFDDPGRRQFLKLMGASLLLAGLTGCGDQTNADHALPYVNQPEELVPGVARYYATAVLFEGYAQPVIATTYDGRPTKLDGNPDHPATRGKSDAFMQSAIFGLYDPERSRMPMHNGGSASWADVDGAFAALRARWRERTGDGLRVLTGVTTSPTLTRQMAALAQQYPGMRWHRFEPVGHALQDDAMTAAFGRPVTPHYRLDRCDVIVSLDHDLLGPGPQQVMHAAAWATKRGEIAPNSGRSKLHVAEAIPGLTGTVASSRLPCDASRLGALAQAIGAQFSLAGWTMPDLSAAEKRWLDRAMSDLRGHQGRALLVVGPHLDPRWQALAAVVNDRLKNTGTTVWYSEPIHVPANDSQSLTTLVADMAAGAVDTLIVLDCNPAYAAPGALDFAKQLARVPNRIHVGLHADETAQLCQWHLPLSHPLETWSDARAVDGSTSIIQPVVRPLYSSRSPHQIADMLLGTVDPAPDAAVRATWRDTFGGGFDDRWARALHDGFVADTAARPISVSARIPAASRPETLLPQGQLDVAFQPDPTIWDGRFANIAWLQELPKPLTKITWDNVIAVSPAIAATQGLSNGDIAEVTIGERHVRGPTWIVPGQAPNTVALFFGYGRRAGGEIAQDSGYDAYSIRPDEHTWATRGTIARVEGRHPLATTQAHHRMEGFDFVREVTAANPRTPPPKDNATFYPDWNETRGAENKPDHAWGMVIDLDLCIGCNACVSACNVENNVLVVGKDQVARGREMLWLRVDRYYTGTPENPKSSFQPVPCMHCEKAPCEMGCPVHATVHSPEGVNQQVYNRCIGTRTCSSYCPYKVRRFNWYDYRHFADAEQAVKNPDVTVRSRGVMEKCTYCTQRIQAAHVEADKENRPLKRDEVVTACQQACPTKAIAFGDIKDKDSTVSQRRRSGRHYVLLEELGTRPRTTYLARWNDGEGEGA